MEQSNFESVCAVEKRIDGTLSELSNLIEDLFNTSSYESSNLPSDYSAISDHFEKACAMLNLIEAACKVQAVLKDSALVEATEQNPLEASKQETLQAILEA